MNHGLSDATVEKIQAVLAGFPQVEKALLYGSRAKGSFKPGSDIDLTLIGPELSFSLLAQIDAALDDLLLPYMIDLSNLASIEDGTLLDHIQLLGVVLYQRGQEEKGPDSPIAKIVEKIKPVESLPS
jgi:predicted nucleotidyltransferase